MENKNWTLSTTTKGSTTLLHLYRYYYTGTITVSMYTQKDHLLNAEAEVEVSQ